jgi:hypothetical protein
MLYKAIVTDKENGKRIFVERDYPTKGDNHWRINKVLQEGK